MKKLIALFLMMALALSCSACKKEPDAPPTETTPSVTTPTVPKQPDEIVPDLDELETMPDIMPDGLSSTELNEKYKNFLENYDWTPYNGFTAVGPMEQCTHVWTNNGEIYDAKIMSVDYEGAIEARYVLYTQDSTTYEVVSTDSGTYLYERQEPAPYDAKYEWNIVNKETVSEYSHTLFQDVIIDVLSFKTTHTYVPTIKAPSSAIYILQDTDSLETLVLTQVENGWEIQTADGTYYQPNEVQFNTETYVITLPNKTIKTQLLSKEDGVETGPSPEPIVEIIKGEIHINRETQEIVCMKDSSRNTTIQFLKDATIDYSIPTNAKRDEEFPADATRILLTFDHLAEDSDRYKK